MMKGFFHLNPDLNNGILADWDSAETRLAAMPATGSGAWAYFPDRTTDLPCREAPRHDCPQAVAYGRTAFGPVTSSDEVATDKAGRKEKII